MTSVRVACAEILQWKVFPYVVINGIHKDIETWIPPQFAQDFDPDKPFAGCYAGALPPDPENNSDDALRLVEVMKREGWWVDISTEPVNFWQCRFSTFTPPMEIKVRAETFCLAITQAVLKAKGHTDLG